MKRALLLACVLVVAAMADGRGVDTDKTKEKKVQVIVQSWLLPGTLASDLKSGKKITDVVITEESTKVNLAEITKGSGDRPKVGDYHRQKMTVYKGKSYKAHDVYLSAALPKRAKLKDFSFKGTFTGKFGESKAHKYSYFEATVVAP